MITSAQTSGVIGAQQTALYNQGLMSRAVGVTSGLDNGAMPPMMPPMGNPDPMGHAIAMALPMGVGAAQSAAGIAGLGAGFGLGGARVAMAAGADPYFMATRGWAGARAGAASAQGVRGLAGMQMALGGATASNVGWAGRLAAGVTGAMGATGATAGIIGATIAAAPAMAAWTTASYAANQTFQGYQERASMKTFADANFQFSNKETGKAGMSPTSISQMTRTVRDTATDMGSTFNEMLGTLQKVTDMGMLDTVRNTKDFEKKFKMITESLKTVSKTLGTSLEDAAGFVGSMRQSGIFEGAVGQNALQRRIFGSEGFKGEEFTAIQKFGGAVAHQYGARRGQGARLATRMTTDMARANRMGIYSDEELIEATGMEGSEGHLAMAQVATQAAFQFTQSPMGTAVLAYAGEMEDGKYTGRIDKKRLAAATSGRMDIQDISREGRERLASGGKGSKTSFVANRQRMSGAMAEMGGPEAIGGMIRSIVGERFGELGEDDITSILMKKISGLDQTQAEILTKMSKEMGAISRQRRRDEVEEVDKVIQDTERAMHHSWEGTKSKVGKEWNKAIRDPIRDLGTTLGDNFEKAGQTISDDWYGRVRAPEVSENRLQDIAYGWEGSTDPGSGTLALANLDFGSADGLFGVALSHDKMSSTARKNLMGAGQEALLKVNDLATKWNPTNFLPFGPHQVGETLLESRVGVDVSLKQVQDEEKLERRRAEGSLRAADVGLLDYQGDMTKVASQILEAMPTGMDYQDKDAVDDMRNRVLKKKNLMKSPELLAALAQATGASEDALLGGDLDRKQKARADDFIRYSMSEGAGAGALAGEAEYMTGATDAARAEKYQDAYSTMFGSRAGADRGFQWFGAKALVKGALNIATAGSFGDGQMRQGLGIGKVAHGMTELFSENVEGRDAVFGMMQQVMGDPGEKGDYSSIGVMEEYIKALESGSTKLLEQDKFDGLRSLDIDQAKAALHTLKEVKRDRHGGLNPGLRDNINSLQQGSRGQIDKKGQVLLQGRGQEMQAQLEKGGRAELEGLGKKGKDLAAQVGEYAKALGEGKSGSLGENVGLEQAKAIRLSLLKMGNKRGEAESSIAGLVGGQQLLDQIGALDAGKDLEGTKSLEEMEKVFKDLGLAVTPKTRKEMQALLDDEVSPGVVSAEEASKLSEAMAKNIGAVDVLSKGGGPITSSIHGDTAQLAAQLGDTEALHAQYATTVADAIEKIAKHTGVDPTPTKPKDVSPAKKGKKDE